jgi:hypothetical protein
MSMAEFSRPTAYIDKLAFVHRTVKAASFRNDKNLAIRELCEAMTELANALIEREQARVLAEEGHSEPEQRPS